MMKRFKILLILILISTPAIMFFPKTLAETSDKVETIGFNSTPIKNNKDFVEKIFRCVEGLYADYQRYPLERQVPFDLIVAMAAYESAWGTSRFAKEGNNFFGIRTWDLDKIPHMKAKGRPDANWGVRKYRSMCSCIQDYIQILNNHPAYEEFRIARSWEVKMYGYTNATTLSRFLVAWSELGEQYTDRLKQIILLIHKKGYYKDLPVNLRGQITYNFK
tara:strand:- start:948 stop:1604 length:657 start_codon:yes stop_codon:yes gene_type:complete